MQDTNQKKLPDIVIKSEADAYKWLERAARDEVPAYGTIRFEGWPTFQLYLKGKKFQRSLTPTVMQALIEFQKGIYRSYSIAKFRDPSTRLTDDERDELEVTVSVKRGSSDLGIDFQEIALKLVENLGGKMSGTEILIAVVSIAVLYFGSSAWATYLENRKETRIKEVSDETQKATLEAMKFASAEETKRAQIMADLAKRDDRIAALERTAYDVHTEVVKAMATASYAKVDGTEVDPEVAEYLTRNARRTSVPARLDGTYRLLKIDWSDPDAFKVKVFNVKTGVHLDAVVQDDSMDGKFKEALKLAEWSRKPVNLRITAKSLGNNVYRDATIVRAELVADDSEEL